MGKTKQNDGSLFHAEAATVGTEDAVVAFQTPSLVASGAEAQQVSILSALLNLPIAFLYTMVPSIITRTGSRKKAVVLLAIVDALTWLPLIAVLFFIGPVAPFWMMGLWIINLIPGVLLLPARDGWLADAVPANLIGRHLGVRTVVSASSYIGMFYLMGYIQDIFTHQLFNGFAIIFLSAFVVTLVKAIFYSRIHDPVKVIEKQPRFSISDFLKKTRGEELQRYIFYSSSLNFAVYLCSPLFAVYMVQHLEFSYLTFAVIISSESVARVISAPLWGKYSDRIGNLPILRKVSYMIPFLPVLWLVSSNVIYLISIQLLAGAIWAGFDICSRSLIYKGASPETKAGYIVCEKSLIALCQAGGALVGAGLLSVMFPIFGSKIFGLFLLSGIMRFVVARIMFPKTRESDKCKTKPLASPPAQPLIGGVINSDNAIPAMASAGQD